MIRGWNDYEFRTFVGLRTVLIALSFFSLCSPLSAADFKSCKNCHTAQLSLEQARNYLHSPFALENCGKCHDLQFPASSQNKGGEEKTASKTQVSAKVTWVADSIISNDSHTFLLPESAVGDKLILELYGDQGRSSRREVAVPSFDNLGKLVDAGNPPIILDASVVEVEYGIFLSASIEWRTDSLADAEVRYGIEDFSQVSTVDGRFGFFHKVTLDQLQPEKTYKCIAVSHDLFGRTQTSEVLTFSTQGAYGSSAGAEGMDGDLENGTLEADFHRLEDHYLIVLKYEIPVRIFLGSSGHREPAALAGGEMSLTEGNDAHADLSDNEAVSIHACRSCHQGQSTATHPVNVLPKPGMIIPPEYPTLPDGRITCGSCHEAHASNYDYLTRKRGKRELCVGCHKDMI